MKVVRVKKKPKAFYHDFTCKVPKLEFEKANTARGRLNMTWPEAMSEIFQELVKRGKGK